ncbi:polysaccharide pyruvyl transferase family protein [Clostridium tarantellae]|uniref:Polysaccharide pyruvyl transferase domain-containing protein n=1 Tax=Clostridium tarantellae TaxID=39493 RepID=A0A6I1MKN6_9CLOT|nr:polysaccharide pyruvyl transferase family protein [Clostridium tarantellae]MPQ43534.1 hypothetical protein [Clostridium tarantellae]
MKIKIEHICNTYNYGSLMMAINIIDRINSKCKDAEFYVDCSTEEDLQRLKKETALNNIFKYEKRELKGSNKISKVLDYKKRLKEESEIFKGVIIIGGDDISEYYGVNLFIKEILKINLRSKHMEVFLVGQTIGPFTKVHTKFLAKSILNKTHVYTRDYDCLQYLKQLGVKNIFDSRDLAFLDLPLQNNKELRANILNKYNLNDEKYITIVPSGLTELYTKNLDDYIRNQVEIVKSILDRKDLKEYKIVLLAHVLRPECVDDGIIIKEIMKKLDKEYKDRIITICQPVLSSEARIILGDSLFTITGRMHAAVSTFQMKKPSIALSYSVKYKGVLGTGLNMNELIIEANDEKLWAKNEVPLEVNKKINYILSNYENIINTINNTMESVQEKVMLQVNNVVEKLK